MQTFIANGRVAVIADDALGRTNKGTTTFKFNFVCDSSQQGDDGRPLPTFFPVQLYGSQADFMSRSLSIGSPILVKGRLSNVSIPIKTGNVVPIPISPQVLMMASLS